MNIILFDNNNRQHLLPFTFLRPISEIRCGILTLTEKWNSVLKGDYSFKTEEYLNVKYPTNIENENLFINGALFPTNEIVTEINSLKLGELLVNKNNELLAVKLGLNDATLFNECELADSKNVKIANSNVNILRNIWDIFSFNDREIKFDFELITNGRISQKISDTNRVICPENIFIEEGAIVEHAIINAKDAKVYIGENAEIMEGSMIRGSFALGEHSVLKMGSKIYGATTIGHDCKVGGEVNNCVFFAYSNKAHDGFVGNSVFAEWCNLGADTNNSNLKNNYAPVKVWNYPKRSFVNTGLQFCGLFMGDHSKCGINTMFNTGTVVGISSNIYGSGFPRNFIPSFSWGGAAGFVHFELEKAKDVAKRMYERRELTFNNADADIFTDVYSLTQTYRDQM